MFTQEELKNMHVLMLRAPIKGEEATTVAQLLQKLASLITKEPPKEENDEPKSNTTS